MPIYEYVCQACGHEKEYLQKMSDPVKVTCPACQQDALQKKLSAPGFRLKGGGWYETDFKTGAKKNLASSDSCAPGGCGNCEGASAAG
ncbi:MAG: zinc ribbon domain-containing protein [Gammaproteobacteria bacterium]|nr:MAG: zinc ribbon domain-containing protein [Gammaproteobacteria bacterium]